MPRITITPLALALAPGLAGVAGGAVRADDFALETVGPEVATTGTPPLGPPRNLDLEK